MGRMFALQRGAARVAFGEGESARIPAEIAALGLRRVLVISTPGRRADAEALAAKLGPLGVGVAALAREHVPAQTVADAQH